MTREVTHCCTSHAWVPHVRHLGPADSYCKDWLSELLQRTRADRLLLGEMAAFMRCNVCNGSRPFKPIELSQD